MASSLLSLLVLFYLSNVIHCCLNNYKYTFINKWPEGTNYKTNMHLKPAFNHQLENWQIKIKFKQPLIADLKVWIAIPVGGSTSGKSEITLSSKPWNKVMNPLDFSLSYIAKFANDPDKGADHLECVEFCGNIPGQSANICDGSVNPPQPTPTTSTVTQPPIKTEGPVVTNGPVTGECRGYDYTEVLRKSLLFYEAQRAGDLPPDQQVTWRHDSFLDDGSSVGLDLTGGYFDAGDYVKFGFPMASTITNLAWGMLEFKQGYIAAGQFDHGLAAIKWGTDYFIKCHPSSNIFYGQVGDGHYDHSLWRRPEDMPENRLVQYVSNNNPGTEIAAETAAALAATSMVFKANGDLTYASTLLDKAKSLYTLGDSYRGNYQHSITNAVSFYTSYSGYKDELAWASLWLYRATGDVTYKDNFMNEFDNQAMNESPEEFSWDNKWNGVKVLAQKIQINGNADYLGKFKNLLQKPKKTPKGLFYVQKWGALRHAANLAFLARVASTIKDADFYNEFAKGQIDYMLGDSGRSYVVGFGNNPPQKPHHRSSSCPETGPCGWDQFNSQSPNPQVLYGALVGGPDQNDGYTDHRGDYIKNEVACDYNAGFQSAIAGLIMIHC